MSQNRSVMVYREDDGNLETDRLNTKFIEGPSAEELAEQFQAELAIMARHKMQFINFLGVTFEVRDYYTQNFHHLRPEQPTYPLFRSLDDYFEQYKMVP